jgi:hypothetical protein
MTLAGGTVLHWTGHQPSILWHHHHGAADAGSKSPVSGDEMLVRERHASLYELERTLSRSGGLDSRLDGMQCRLLVESRGFNLSTMSTSSQEAENQVL